MKTRSTTSVVVLAAVLFAVVVGTYLLKFFSFSLSSSVAEWGQLGDYLGGVLNPLLSFLTLIVVVSNYRDEQIRNSKSELETAIFQYVRFLEKCEVELDHAVSKSKPRFRPYSNIPASSNARKGGGHPDFWELTDRWNMMKSFYAKIKELDQNNPVISYIDMKYSDVKKELIDLGYMKE